MTRPGSGPAHDDDYHVADDLLIRTADLLWFGDRAERAIEFNKYDKNGELVAADPSDKILKRVSNIITKTDFAPLKGTTETPTLREDYSLLTTPGYDRKSGLYYDPGRAVFPDDPRHYQQKLMRVVLLNCSRATVAS